MANMQISDCRSCPTCRFPWNVRATSEIRFAGSAGPSVPP